MTISFDSKKNNEFLDQATETANTSSPLENESPFGIQEIFISRTDKKGIINFGNEVFCRVSGYNREQLMGSPHNVVRHSDMPRAVFKLFWNTLKSDKIIGAYVKNKALDGSYYWVFATAFPVAEGYFSIRIKPTSVLFEKVKEIYIEALAIESEKGVDESLNCILNSLKKLGFPNYEQFMSAALQEEVFARDTHLLDNNINYQTDSSLFKNRLLASLKARIDENLSELTKTQTVVTDLRSLKAIHDQVGSTIAKACEKMEGLAINMSISAHKLGKDGATLSVISNSFQTTSELIHKSYSTIESEFKKLCNGIPDIILGANCFRIQTEMIAAYLTEVDMDLQNVSQSQRTDSFSNALGETYRILKSAQSLFYVNSKQQSDFFAIIVHLQKNVTYLQKQIMRLDLISTGGKLEGSRTNTIAQKFKPFLNEMSSLLRTLETPIGEMLKSLGVNASSFGSFLTSIHNIEFALNELTMVLQQEVQDEEIQHAEAA